MSSERYRRALARIPPGETRSFLELAAMAGRPGAARAVGRAVAGASWPGRHRLVDWRGRARDDRALTRLQREGARPRRGELLVDWTERVGARIVGHYATRRAFPVSEAALSRLDPRELEPLADVAHARARGFRAPGEPRVAPPPLPERRALPAAARTPTLEARLGAVDWEHARRALRERGVVTLEALFTPRECRRILNDSTEPARFERSVDMLAKGYGVGAYHFYREPVPQPAGRLRESLYRKLAPDGFEPELSEFWRRCRRHDQRRPSSILIVYPTAGINHPHRDVYGPVAFPYQALVVLSRAERDFAGGEFYVTDDTEAGETTTVPVSEGDVVLFATRERRPEGSRRGIALRHGMRAVTKGTRYGLGLVFHLAR